MHGSAGVDEHIENVQLYFKKSKKSIGGGKESWQSTYVLWAKIKGLDNKKNDKLYKKITATINIRTSTPPLPILYTEFDKPYDADDAASVAVERTRLGDVTGENEGELLKTVDTAEGSKDLVSVTSMETLYQDLNPGTREFRELVQGTNGEQRYTIKWQSNVQEVTDELHGDYVKRIGAFNQYDIVRIDLSDKGCSSNIGMHFHVTSRWGNTEAFLLGTANDAKAQHFSLYRLAHNKTQYFLYLAVKNFAPGCGSKDTPKEHIMKISVRSSGVWKASQAQMAKAPPTGPCGGKMCESEKWTKIPVQALEDDVKKLAEISAPAMRDLVKWPEGGIDGRIKENPEWAAGPDFKPGISSKRIMSAKVTDFGLENKKRVEVKYLGNIAKSNEAFALQIPVGVVRTYQPLRIVVEDQGHSSGVGHDFTCLMRRPPAATASDQVQMKYMPECFYYGSASRDDVQDRIKFYFVLPQYAPQLGCGGTKDTFSCIQDRTKAGDANGAAFDKFQRGDEVLVYLAITDFGPLPKPQLHTLTMEVSSSMPVQWCMQGQPGYPTATGQQTGCSFNGTEASQFWWATQTYQSLTDPCVFPLKGWQLDACVKNDKSYTGRDIDMLAVEDVVQEMDQFTKKSKECYNRKPAEFLDVDKMECVAKTR
jgi:hypothetical protein